MNEPLRIRFGENVRIKRRRAGLSQEELGFRAAIHRTVISSLERGKQTPRLDTILKLAGALEASPCELLNGFLWRPGWSVPGRFEIDGLLQTRPPGNPRPSAWQR
jgi:transcriptional regulator with XRE-family HTH domain